MLASVYDTERAPRECVFTATEVEYLDGIACMFAAPSQTSLLLPKAQNSELPAIAEEEGRQDIRRAYISGK